MANSQNNKQKLKKKKEVVQHIDNWSNLKS